MKARKLLSSLSLSLSVSLIAVAALPVPAAHALLVKVQINFGPVITGPDNRTLVVQASPGDMLRITWALGADVSIDRYRGWVFGVEGVSGIDTTEITRAVGSALELTGQGFDPAGNPNAPFPGGEASYNASSDGAPIGFAGNGGELWLIEYLVTNPITDADADISFRFDNVFQCFADSGPPICPGSPGTASLRIDAVPEPSSVLLLGSRPVLLAHRRRRS